MSQVLDFTSVARSSRFARRADDAVRHLPDDTGDADPNNTPRRVLSEMFLVLMAATLVAGSLTWLAPALS